MWLSGSNQPDFRTINEFRGKTLEAVFGPVFAAILEYLIEAGYVKLEHYIVDGTKIEANANKHKVVWAKRNQKNQAPQEKIQELLEQIEETNEAEQAEYGDCALEEAGGESGPIAAAKLEQKIIELNRRLLPSRVIQLWNRAETHIERTIASLLHIQN